MEGRWPEAVERNMSELYSADRTGVKRMLRNRGKKSSQRKEPANG